MTDKQTPTDAAAPECLTCSDYGAVGNSGFGYKTAADFLSGKPVSDEALRQFVVAAKCTHDARAALHARMLLLQGELASREAEIALLKRSLLDAAASASAPQPTTAPATQQAVATGECTGPRCMASSANGYAHSRECIDEAAETQGWTPTADDYAKCGPSAPQPVAREPLADEQFGEICDRLTKLVREKRAKHIQRGIDAGAEYYIGDAAHHVGHAVNQAAHGIKGAQHGTE